MKKFNITYKSENLGKFEQIKRCLTSTGYDIRLFKSDTAVMPYLVTVKKGDETIEFKRFFHGGAPYTFYLDMICCYA